MDLTVISVVLTLNTVDSITHSVTGTESLSVMSVVAQVNLEWKHGENTVL